MNLAIKTVTATCNGVTQNLAYDSASSTYKISNFVAPNKSSYNQPNKVYVVTITATDEAGNVATKTTTLTVKEKVKPTCAFVSPAEDALLRSVRPTITWQCKDDDSGVNTNTVGITIDSGAKITAGITKTAITGGLQCAYTPTTDLAQGSHTIKLDCTDNDGNVATTATRTIVCDTVNPVLVVSTPTVTLTKVPSCTFSGTATDATTAPCSVSIKQNSAAAISVPVSDTGAWSKALTLVEGNNTVVITATDRAGNSTTITKTIKLDTAAPVFGNVSISPNPVDASTNFVITVNVTDD